MNLSWMAWTLPTGLFFAGIVLILASMALWARLRPANAPRVGILGLATQRGDRLFLALLGSAFIHLAWAAWAPLPLFVGSLISLVYAAAVFRFV